MGVLYNNASDSITDVTVADITQHSACLSVHSILLQATTPQSVTIAQVDIPNFQRTLGPPDLQVPNPDRLTQNTIQVGSPAFSGPTGGLIANNTIIAGAYGAPTNLSVGLLAYNAINRNPNPPPGFLDAYGYGASSDDTSKATALLICNTFSGWNLNLDNLVQPPCIVTLEPPCAIIGEPYSVQLQATVSHPDAVLTWRLASGRLPPGLTLSADGVVSGTSNRGQDTVATVEVSDPIDGSATADIPFCVEAPPPGTIPPNPPDSTTPPDSPTSPGSPIPPGSPTSPGSPTAPVSPSHPAAPSDPAAPKPPTPAPASEATRAARARRTLPVTGPIQSVQLAGVALVATLAGITLLAIGAPPRRRDRQR
ncbi:hypothetical protein GCM10009839_40490 [Catenulispora yoronensis]|uniref:Ig-like domain-containing protein n=1 Tax=Catenulispora yoronensis TaxID=450799 RepID=A0ABP5FZ76_9ACTN